MPTSQYALALALPAVYAEDNFAVSDCNREAHRWIEAWANWPANALVIYGDRGCGKTHLGHIWARRAQADVYDAADETLTPDTLSGNALIENIERLKNEARLFHLLNHSREQGHYLLLTSAVAPKLLPFTLKDLTSRLLALPAAAITPPDEDVLAAAMRKQFSDRQLKVPDESLAFLLSRMERSFSSVASIVATLDEHALREHKNLTVPFLKQTLGY